MIALAIGYGFLTLVALWSGAGSNAAGLADRVWIAFVLYLVTCAALCKFKPDSAPQTKPLKLFQNKKQTLIAAAALAISVGYLVVLKFSFAEYFANQSHAVAALGVTTSIAFALTLALSDFAYRSFFAPAWGAASAAFLEALTWGLATQSFAAFAWIFASDWILSKFAGTGAEWGSVLVRLLAGFAWIALR